MMRVVRGAEAEDGDVGGSNAAPETGPHYSEADPAAPSLPNASYLHSRAREVYDRLVGSYVTRGWPTPLVEHAAQLLLAHFAGEQILRQSGAGRRELTEEEQVIVLEAVGQDIEAEFGPRARR